MSERFERLGAEVARVQDQSLTDERRRVEVRHRLVETPAPLPMTPRRWRPVLALAVVGVAAFAMWTSGRRTPQPVAYRVDRGVELTEVDVPIAAPPTRSMPVRFTDGSAVRLAPETRAHVTELTEEGATLELDQGTVTVSVKHRTSTRWAVRAGPFLVRVTGTRFLVRWTPDSQSFELEVFEGEVRVTGPDAPETAVRAGDELRLKPKAQTPPEPVREPSLPPASPEPPKTAPEPQRESSLPVASPELPRKRPGLPERPAATEPRPAPPPKEPRGESAPVEQGQARESEATTPNPEPSSTEPPPSSAEPPPSSTEPPPSSAEPPLEEPAPPSEPWRAFFERGEYDRALVELAPEDVERALWQADAAQLMELGAAARRANDGRAGYIYSVVRSRFPGARASADAAFMLARMYFHGGTPRTAAIWLETYLREQPDGRFAREAAGRLVEAYQQAEETDRARVAAERYLARYPDGPHAKLARSVLE